MLHATSVLNNIFNFIKFFRMAQRQLTAEEVLALFNQNDEPEDDMEEFLALGSDEEFEDLVLVEEVYGKHKNKI